MNKLLLAKTFHRSRLARLSSNMPTLDRQSKTPTLTKTMYVAASQGSRLEKRTEEVPVLGPQDVLINLKAIAINPADTKMIDQGHRITSWPIVPGLDGAGIVQSVGGEVTRFAEGDRVLAQFTPGPVENGGGSYQDLAVAKESMVAKVPDGLAWSEAASIPVCYLTAMVGLGTGLGLALPFLKDGPRDGLSFKSILVLGGSSALGASAIQLLRLAAPDARILVTASPKHFELLMKHLGIQHVIDRSSSSLIEGIKNLTEDKAGVDAILDAVGAGASDKCVFEAFSPTGPKRYAQVWTGDDEIKAPDGVDSVLFRSRDFMNVPGGQNFFLALEELLRNGEYKAPLPIRETKRGLENLEAGLELMRQGVSGEKITVPL